MSAGWQVTLREPIWHLSYRIGEAGLHYQFANRNTALTYLLTSFNISSDGKRNREMTRLTREISSATVCRFISRQTGNGSHSVASDRCPLKLSFYPPSVCVDCRDYDETDGVVYEQLISERSTTEQTRRRYRCGNVKSRRTSEPATSHSRHSRPESCPEPKLNPNLTL